jgi:hypothetical protein
MDDKAMERFSDAVNVIGDGRVLATWTPLDLKRVYDSETNRGILLQISQLEHPVILSLESVMRNATQLREILDAHEPAKKNS